MKRAGKMTVIPCDREGVFHVIGGSRPHTIRVPRVGAPVCDCEAGAFGNSWCAHRLAFHWHQGNAADSAAIGA